MVAANPRSGSPGGSSDGGTSGDDVATVGSDVPKVGARAGGRGSFAYEVDCCMSSNPTSVIRSPQKAAATAVAKAWKQKHASSQLYTTEFGGDVDNTQMKEKILPRLLMEPMQQHMQSQGHLLHLLQPQLHQQQPLSSAQSPPAARRAQDAAHTREPPQVAPATRRAPAAAHTRAPPLDTTIPTTHTRAFTAPRSTNSTT